MTPNKDLLTLGFALDNYVVTKVDIKCMHNLSDKPRNVGNGGFPAPILHYFLNPHSPKTIKFHRSLKNEPTSYILLKKILILKFKEIVGIGIFRRIPWGRGHDLPFIFGFGE